MSKEKTFILSDSSKVNSFGFKIDFAGMDITRFESNPVMLYRHDYGQLIGKWEGLRKEEDKLIATAVFDAEDPVGKAIEGKVSRGFLKGCSIGIRITDIAVGDKYDTVTGCELIEASIVPVPSDAGAVVLYDENRKELNYKDIKLHFNNNKTNTKKMEEEPTKKLEATIAERDARIAELEAKISENEKRAVSALLDMAVASGKIRKEERESFEKLAALDFDAVKSIIDGREEKASVTLSEMAAAARAATPSGREDWTYLEWMKKDPQGLKRMKLENPKEFKRLQGTL
jgi:HK97 family phage prohead protease